MGMAMESATASKEIVTTPRLRPDYATQHALVLSPARMLSNVNMEFS